jgi:hypothetical protein
MSNYPPGVTGREYEIAGADAEWTETKTVHCQMEDCPRFEEEVEVELDLQSYRGEWWGTYTCPTCDKDSDFDGNLEDMRDYDTEYDAWREARDF